MRGILRKYQFVAATGIFLAVVVGSSVAFAHFGSDPEVTGTKPAAQAKVEADSTSQPAINPTPQPVQSNPCTKTVTENNTTSGSDVTNVKKTEVRCESHSQSGSTTVDITNDSNQTAQTGNSTGQTGTASNSNDTDIRVSP